MSSPRPLPRQYKSRWLSLYQAIWLNLRIDKQVMTQLNQCTNSQDINPNQQWGGDNWKWAQMTAIRLASCRIHPPTTTNASTNNGSIDWLSESWWIIVDDSGGGRTLLSMSCFMQLYLEFTRILFLFDHHYEVFCFNWNRSYQCVINRIGAIIDYIIIKSSLISGILIAF